MTNNEMSTKGSHPGGRPTKYTPIMVDRLESYMRNCPDELSSKAGFGNFVGVHVNTMNNWGRKHPEFLWALRRLHTLQESELINKGLAGQYNSTICKFLLCNNHGYRNRRDIVTESKPVSIISISVNDCCNEFSAPIKKGSEVFGEFGLPKKR